MLLSVLTQLNFTRLGQETQCFRTRSSTGLRRIEEKLYGLLGDVDHALEGDAGPVLLILRDGDLIPEVLHRPAEMRRIDPEHRRAADGRREQEDLLVGDRCFKRERERCCL
jgi:hypothetical protein